jgi:hypothetical protein
MPDLPIACTLIPDGMTARLALIDLMLEISGPGEARPVIELLFAPDPT